MFSRLKIASISLFASGLDTSEPTVMFDAPISCSRGFRPLPSERARSISAPSPASPVTLDSPPSVRRFMFGPSSTGIADSYGLC